jgi:hypothetical protein
VIDRDLDDEPEPDWPVSDPLVRLVRTLPWLLLVGVLVAIFVFTAYARS